MDQGTTRETPGDPGGFLGQLDRKWQLANNTLPSQLYGNQGGQDATNHRGKTGRIDRRRMSLLCLRRSRASWETIADRERRSLAT